MYNLLNKGSDIMKLSELIVEYRREHDLSQRQFALQCGVSNGYISMLEKERNPKTGEPIVPSMQHYAKIAKGMGISLQELFQRIDDAPVSLGKNQPASGRDELIPEITEALSELSLKERKLLLGLIKEIQSSR